LNEKPETWEFIVTQKHFESILDLIGTILQKIASGEISEDDACNNMFFRTNNPGRRFAQPLARGH
jgi:hypothetical protein